MLKNKCKRKFFALHKQVCDIGFFILTIGVISICAFILPANAWIFILAVILILVGIFLLDK